MLTFVTHDNAVKSNVPPAFTSSQRPTAGIRSFRILDLLQLQIQLIIAKLT
jgi:hypothetical protein